MLRGLLAPADLVEAFITDAEVVADFVKDRLADLFAETFGGEPHPEVRLAVDGDLVRHGSEVVLATVGQHHTFIETKEVPVLFDLIGTGTFLDDDVKIVDAFHHPFGQLGKDLVYDCLELV